MQILIDALTGRIVYLKRYGGAGYNNHLLMKSCDSLRNRLERLKIRIEK